MGIVKDIVESIGIGISYAYDDLIFVEHNAFILQFAENDNELFFHINSEADKKKVRNSIGSLNNAAAERGMAIKEGKYYSLVQADDENIRLEFC